MDIAKKYFSKDVNDRDRAIFEGAITLGATFHQFIGTPIKNDPKILSKLKSAIESSMSCQPFIEDVKVDLVLPKIKSGQHSYDYSTINENNFNLKVISKYGNVRVTFGMKFVEELSFPLMYIEDIEEQA